MAFGENTVNDVVTGYGLTEAAVWWLIEEGGGEMPIGFALTQ